MAEILDAALLEFSEKGYAATRMDDIAQRAGLSKGGLYAHYDSKDAIFEALLNRMLRRTDWSEMPRLAAGASTREVAQWVVERLHAALLNPTTVANLRLLVAESERVPHLMRLWESNVVQPHMEMIEGVLRANAALGGQRRGVLLAHPWLALSPAMHMLLWHTIFGSGLLPYADAREAHIDLLCELMDMAT